MDRQTLSRGEIHSLFETEQILSPVEVKTLTHHDETSNGHIQFLSLFSKFVTAYTLPLARARFSTLAHSGVLTSRDREVETKSDVRCVIPTVRCAVRVRVCMRGVLVQVQRVGCKDKKNFDSPSTQSLTVVRRDICLHQKHRNLKVSAVVVKILA
jgi:hypothetical protein